MSIVYKKPEALPWIFTLGYILTIFVGIFLIFSWIKFNEGRDWYVGLLGLLIFLFGLINLIRNIKTKKEHFWDIKNPYVAALILIIIWVVIFIFHRRFSIIFGIVFILVYYKTFFGKKKPALL